VVALVEAALSPDSLISSALIFPRGRARRVEGGYRLSGRWPFSSGIDPSTWNMFGAVVSDEETGENEPRMFLVPASDYSVIDTWQVIGLAGTGSKDVEVADVFVPAYRTLAIERIKGGPNRGSELNPGHCTSCRRSVCSVAIAGVLLGIARRALCARYGDAANRRIYMMSRDIIRSAAPNILGRRLRSQSRGAAQVCVIGYFAKIVSARLKALSIACSGVIPLFMTSSMAMLKTCSALTSAIAGLNAS